VKKDAGKAFDPRVVEVLAARYVELERKAKASAMSQRAKLSTDLKVERGAAPGAGFADQSTSDLLSIHRSIEGEAQIARLLSLGERLGRCGGSTEAFAVLREQLGAAVPYDVLVLYRDEDHSLVPQFLDGDGQEQFASLRIPLGMGLAGWVAENHKAIVNGNPSVEPGYLNDPSKFSTLGSALAVPVEMPAGPPGVLSLYRRERDAFRADEMRMLQSIASKLGAALDLAPQPR
jgi:hypothetical protein